MAEEKTEKRKTYSLDHTMSRELARKALDLSDDIGRNIPRQAILDALVASLKDKTVYAKVRSFLKTTA